MCRWKWKNCVRTHTHSCKGIPRERTISFYFKMISIDLTINELVRKKRWMDWRYNQMEHLKWWSLMSSSNTKKLCWSISIALWICGFMYVHITQLIWDGWNIICVQHIIDYCSCFFLSLSRWREVYETYWWQMSKE